jgi:hypothetical protein
MCADRSYTLDYSTNFPSSYSTPIAETAIKFELRESNTLNKIGVAVFNYYDVFLNWIKKEDIYKLPIDKLSKLDSIILIICQGCCLDQSSFS